MPPGTVDGMKHVCYFRHALALDERRVKFLPEYSYGGSTTPPSTGSKSDTNRTSSSSQRPNAGPASDSPPHTLEVWFPGTHSDMYACFCQESLGWQTFIFKSEAAEISKTKAWIVAGLHSGGWLLKLAVLAFGQHYSSAILHTSVRIPHRTSNLTS